MSQGAGGNQVKSIGPGAEPRLVWDIGTAYDFFMSLEVLHQPERYGLRPSWAAGVRSRLPPAERKMLEDIQHFLWLPLHWINTLPAPKDAAAALWSLRQIPAEQRPLQMINSNETPPTLYAALQKIAHNRAWDDGDLEIFRSVLSEYKKGHLVKDLIVYLDWFSRPDELGELYLSALQAYYQGFFAEEEKRIAPVLSEGMAEAQELAGRLPLADLFTELSQGVHFEQAFTATEIVLIPGYWNTPLVIFPSIGSDRVAFMFGVRPMDMSLIPGEPVPDALLRVLKALADPTRLRILRYLREETLTPAQLSRKLRLRAPTVTHHLQTLRLAGLVNISIESESEKGYTSRLDAIQSAFTNLEGYLSSDRPEGGEG
jgi:DNA-binding transcriptional ArsR family regulator